MGRFRLKGIKVDPNEKRSVYLCELCGKGIEAKAKDPVVFCRELGWRPYHGNNCLRIAMQKKHAAEAVEEREKHEARSRQAREQWYRLHGQRKKWVLR